MFQLGVRNWVLMLRVLLVRGAFKYYHDIPDNGGENYQISPSLFLGGFGRIEHTENSDPNSNMIVNPETLSYSHNHPTSVSFYQPFNQQQGYHSFPGEAQGPDESSFFMPDLFHDFHVAWPSSHQFPSDGTPSEPGQHSSFEGATGTQHIDQNPQTHLTYTWNNHVSQPDDWAVGQTAAALEFPNESFQNFLPPAWHTIPSAEVQNAAQRFKTAAADARRLRMKKRKHQKLGIYSEKNLAPRKRNNLKSDVGAKHDPHQAALQNLENNKGKNMENDDSQTKPFVISADEGFYAQMAAMRTFRRGCKYRANFKKALRDKVSQDENWKGLEQRNHAAVGGRVEDIAERLWNVNVRIIQRLGAHVEASSIRTEEKNLVEWLFGEIKQGFPKELSPHGIESSTIVWDYFWKAVIASDESRSVLKSWNVVASPGSGSNQNKVSRTEVLETKSAINILGTYYKNKNSTKWNLYFGSDERFAGFLEHLYGRLFNSKTLTEVSSSRVFPWQDNKEQSTTERDALIAMLNKRRKAMRHKRPTPDVETTPEGI
ncbi:hypothetical protein O181_020123 [Austropuccinia psidii MF-1]|uniref:Uncharacterized protein n=1 Tax=Austropuccinia psidii MF-1 TaxID=1389203 RepID=A0A9Q3CAV6_9BASI|nr:hypothetical protein [Austropuccinia psidii MF-1]